LRPSSLLPEIPHLAAIHDQCDVGDTYPTHTAGERAGAPLHIPKMVKCGIWKVLSAAKYQHGGVE